MINFDLKKKIKINNRIRRSTQNNKFTQYGHHLFNYCINVPLK